MGIGTPFPRSGQPELIEGGKSRPYDRDSARRRILRSGSRRIDFALFARSELLHVVDRRSKHFQRPPGGSKVPPSADFTAQANISTEAQYQEMCRRAKEDPSGFWGDLARENLEWSTPFRETLSGDMPETKWFVGGKLNASVQCLDRHVATWRKNKAAIIWEGEPEIQGF